MEDFFFKTQIELSEMKITMYEIINLLSRLHGILEIAKQKISEHKIYQ